MPGAETLGDVIPAVGFAADERGLSVLAERSCAAALWPRTMPADVESWLAGLSLDHLPRGRIALRPTAVAQEVAQLCDMVEMPQGPERSWLEQDISHLAALFADLMEVDFVRLRLDVVTTNACRKFHVDAVTARLVCTYRGQGTQYGVAIEGHDPERIDQVPIGAPILLRGTLWPEEPASGLRHRSPPIEGTGETRLLLVLDPIFDPEDAI